MFMIKNAKEYNQSKVNFEGVGIKAVDENTLVVELVEENPYFDRVVAQGLFYPVNTEFYKKTKDEEEYNTVLYLDGDKNNCKLSNLKWSLSETSTSKYYRGVWADITPLPEGWSKYILIKGEIPKEYPYLTGKSGIYTAASKGTTYKGYRWTKYE
jgi:hypothetical protein